jgi:O-antigen ligase
VFAIPGIAVLIVFILCRPQEFIEALQKLPMLYLCAAAAVGGFVLDIKLRRLQPIAAPTLPWIVAFIVWALICNAVKVPDKFTGLAIELAILFVLYGTIAHGVQRFRNFQVVAGTVLAACMFLTFVCFHQGFQDHGCLLTNDVTPGEGVPDGRACESPRVPDACYGAGAEPGAEYRCEKVGMFGTYSIEGRVRYRGEVNDPNELAMTICLGGLAFVIAFVQRRRTPGAVLLGTLGGILVLWTVLMTQSRGGLVVALAVPGVYFVKRYGLAGLVVAAAGAVPLLALSGDGGRDMSAAASTELRYEAWASGLEMFKASPLFGVGQRQFAEHHFMTAHNSYILALAELGFVGLVLFVTLMYLSMKGLWVGLRQLENVPGAQVARVWGMALLAGFFGMAFQIGTLSFAYHSVLWVFLGLAAAWVGAVRHHMPELRIRMTVRELVIVTAACAVYALMVLPLFLRWKGMM